MMRVEKPLFLIHGEDGCLAESQLDCPRFRAIAAVSVSELRRGGGIDLSSEMVS